MWVSKWNKICTINWVTSFSDHCTLLSFIWETWQFYQHPEMRCRTSSFFYHGLGLVCGYRCQLWSLRPSSLLRQGSGPCPLPSCLSSAASSGAQEPFPKHCALLGRNHLYCTPSCISKSRVHAVIMKFLGISPPLLRWFALEPIGDKGHGFLCLVSLKSQRGRILNLVREYRKVNTIVEGLLFRRDAEYR